MHSLVSKTCCKVLVLERERQAQSHTLTHTVSDNKGDQYLGSDTPGQGVAQATTSVSPDCQHSTDASSYIIQANAFCEVQ